jgi:hypothetical protein
MAEIVVSGLALYIRKIDRKERTPKAFAQRLKAMGLKWVAIGGPWQQITNGKLSTGLMNSVETCREYSDACALEGLEPYIWGYPWLGGEPVFISRMLECSGDHKLLLLDPELGMNPERSSKKVSYQRSEASAHEIVTRLRTGGAKRIGLSTYGTIPKVGSGEPWFPLEAFIRAGLDFIGGQVYTDDSRADISIAFFLGVLRKLGVDIQLVPNFGTYSWRDPKAKPRKARSKTPPELAHHLLEFVDEAEPVEALIGWAENFVTKAQEAELLKFSRLLAQGIFKLPQPF